MEKLTDDEFAEAIEQAVDSMPDQFITALENIVLTMDDEPTDFQLDNVRKSNPDQIDPRYGEVLGLCHFGVFQQHGQRKARGGAAFLCDALFQRPFAGWRQSAASLHAFADGAGDLGAVDLSHACIISRPRALIKRGSYYGAMPHAPVGE